MTAAHSLPLLLLLSWTTLTDGAVFTADQTTQIDNFITTLMDCNDIPGLSIAVVKGNETWKRGYGMADKASGRQVTTSTLFGIGSVTKSFTASLLSTLFNDTNGYSWETPVVDILGPDFRLGDDYITQHVTLRDLLSHRTGLAPNNIPIFTGSPDSMTRALLEQRIRLLPIVAPFRDRFEYNNLMYTLAGRVAEVIGGASWEELLRTRLLQPVGMTRSTVLGPSLDMGTGDFATAYIIMEGQEQAVDWSLFGDLAPHQPAGGIVSSADDMSRWLYVLLHQGNTTEGATILEESRMREMQSATVVYSAVDGGPLRKPPFPVSNIDFGYGYGWFISEYKGYSFIYHSGMIYAYISFLGFIKDLDLGVFITTNGPGTNQAAVSNGEIFYYLTELVLGETPWINTDTACTFPEPWQNASAQTEGLPDRDRSVIDDNGWADVRDYVGSYGNLLLGELVVVEEEGNRLSATLNHFQGRLHRTDQANLVMYEATGIHRVIPANDTNYLQLTFVNADNDGVYQAVELAENIAWTFQRGVQFDPLPGTVADPLIG